jgi:oxygen-independent coproporphyrinogen-3 oxidase
MHFDPKDIFQVGMQHHAIANTAFPIAHKITMRPYKVQSEDIQNHVRDAWRSIGEMWLYVHIPFCEKICGFCDYSVMNPEIRYTQEPLYFQALHKEMRMWSESIELSSKKLLGFDIGGGTPSSVDSRYIGQLMNDVDTFFDLSSEMNISLETTPKIAAEDPQKIKDYHNMGIRRISMWIQTITPQAIDRESTSILWNKQATEHIRNAWFKQFNIDLMYGFANQTVDQVRSSIEHVVSLDPEFVTLYRMRYKRTKVEKNAWKVELEWVHDQYMLAKYMLANAGYEMRHGKNTFSKMSGNDGLSDYLHHRVERATPYLGFGMWAQSFSAFWSLAYNGWSIVKHPDHYYKYLNEGKLPIESAHHLSREASMAKMISVSFYSGGIHQESFRETFGISLEEAFPQEVEFVIENGYMVNDEKYGTLQLTELWAKYMSGVIALFYTGEVKKYLLSIDENGWMETNIIERPISTRLQIQQII